MKSAVKSEFILALVLLFVTGASCVPRHPTKTERPVLDTPPWQERHITSPVSGAGYRYLFAESKVSDAPALLLLHGGFFDERIWSNASDLASRFNVYALSWPDDSPFYDGSFAGFGRVARDFLAALGLSEVTVAGVSMGSLVAIDLASGYPEVKVKALVLCSAVMLALNEEEIKERLRIAGLARGRSPERLRAFIEWRESRAELATPPAGPTQHDIFWVRPASYYKQVFDSVGNQGNRRQPTDRIECPVLFVSGTADETMPIAAVRQGLSLFPRAAAVEMKEVEGADHTMVFARGPQVANVMLDFLERHGI